MPDNMAIMLLEAATYGNSDFLSAWTQRQIMTEEMNPGGPTLTYDEYYKYLLQIAKKLEISVVINTSARKANSSETDYLSQNLPSDPDYH